MATTNKKAPVKMISKPFLKGKAFDSTVIKSSAAIFGGMLLLMIVFLLLGTMMMFDQRVLSVLLNIVLLFGSYSIFYANGVSRGATAVNQGEILYQRRETNREIRPTELESCFHPAKGFITGLLGTVPVFVIAVIFAFMTKRQLTTMGALPSWISNISGHSEVTDTIAYYTSNLGFTLTDILRVFVRMNVMPYVNIFNSSDMDAMFLLERIAPVLVLLPGLSYGIGYTQGINARARVHGDIALGKRKQAKKARKQRALKMKETQKLN